MARWGQCDGLWHILHAIYGTLYGAIITQMELWIQHQHCVDELGYAANEIHWNDPRL